MTSPEKSVVQEAEALLESINARIESIQTCGNGSFCAVCDNQRRAIREDLDALLAGFRPIPATPDPRAEAERLYARIGSYPVENWANEALRVLHLFDEALTAKDEELRSLRETFDDEFDQVWQRAEKAEAELRSLREASAGAQWQDISTAPKDGTLVLAHSRGDGMGLGYFDTRFGYWISSDDGVRLRPEVWCAVPPLPSPPGAPAATSPSEEDAGLLGNTASDDSGVGAPRRENKP